MVSVRQRSKTSHSRPPFRGVRRETRDLRRETRRPSAPPDALRGCAARGRGARQLRDSTRDRPHPACTVVRTPDYESVALAGRSGCGPDACRCDPRWRQEARMTPLALVGTTNGQRIDSPGRSVARTARTIPDRSRVRCLHHPSVSKVTAARRQQCREDGSEAPLRLHRTPAVRPQDPQRDPSAHAQDEDTQARQHLATPPRNGLADQLGMS